MAAAAAALLMAALLGSCIEPVDKELPVSGTSATGAVWEYVGAFGGQAEVSTPSSDPWEIRFERGKFREIAGVCATDNEVWVCDLAVSRIQIFDFEGNLKRTIGNGVSVRDTLLSFRELYTEDINFPRVHDGTVKRWEAKEGRRWVTDRKDLFKAADVQVLDNGYVIADQARTSLFHKSGRSQRVAAFYDDGSEYTSTRSHFAWPAYLALDGTTLAVAERPGNALWLAEMTDQAWPFKVLTEETAYRDYVRVLVEHANDENFTVHEQLVLRAGSMANKYNGLGGVAIAFDKLVACDRGNRRLQVMEASRDSAARWGKVVRVVTEETELGAVRFDTPIDIDIDSAGRIYLLDVGRREVAVLADNFERIGSFGHDEIVAPWAIDLSDDGKHCFITDQRLNQVLHYVRTD